jgi:hypothetical protein
MTVTSLPAFAVICTDTPGEAFALSITPHTLAAFGLFGGIILPTNSSQGEAGLPRERQTGYSAEQDQEKCNNN